MYVNVEIQEVWYVSDIQNTFPFKANLILKNNQKKHCSS